MWKSANAASKFVELSGGERILYRDEGRRDGAALVLIHGSNASLQTWEPRVAEPGGTFRIISFDLPGHGLTGPAPSEDCSIEAMAEVVDRFPAEIGVDHVALAGNSMGGNIS